MTAAEAAGRLEDAETIWRALGETDQALRCRVAQLERAGQLATAAAALEERGWFEAAGQAWERAGEPSGQLRCDARRLEKRKRWDQAGACWTSLGETKKAALCLARYRLFQGTYAEAADAFEEAGDGEAALQTRIIAARVAGDPQRAISLADAAGRPELVRDLRTGRASSRGPEGGPAKRAEGAGSGRATRRSASGSRPAPVERIASSGPTPVPGGASSHEAVPASGRAGSAAHGARRTAHLPRHPARSPSDDLNVVVAAVNGQPGLLSREVAFLTGLAHERVQSLLREAVASRLVFKAGATGAARYWPAGTRPGIGS